MKASPCLRSEKPARHALVASLDGRILLTNARAREWLRRFFPRPRHAGFLPVTVRRWLDATAGRRDRPSLLATSAERCLFVRRYYPEPDDCAMLLLELHARRLLGMSHNEGKLTSRENEILRWMSTGLSTTEMAQALGIAASTAGKHVEHILCKLGAKNRVEAVTIALRNHLLG